MTQKLLVATHNRGKMREYAEMLADMRVDWLNLDDAGVTADVAETGLTFQENAVLKARTYARQAGILTLADDSGLEVDALSGEPGVHTARYGGPGLTHEERYRLLLSRLDGVGWEERSARFRCVIALAGAAGSILGTAEGVCDGVIALEPSGVGGFGYDPIFYLPELRQTMAELESAVKHQISHRGRALRAIQPLLARVLAGQVQSSEEK